MSKVASALEFTADDIYKCSVLNMRSFIFILCFIFILSCISAIINSFFIDQNTMDDLILEEIMRRRQMRNQTRFLQNNLEGKGLLIEEYQKNLKPSEQGMMEPVIEKFSNEDFYSEIDSLKPNYSNYQFTRLTGPNDEFGNPANYQTGQAYRLLRPASKNFMDKKMELFMDIQANLFLLNGNPFGEENVADNKVSQQDYLVYLVNTKTDKKRFVNKLLRDGDDIYKFKYQTVDPEEIKELLSYDKIIITHKKDSSEKEVLQGNFLKNI